MKKICLIFITLLLLTNICYADTIQVKFDLVPSEELIDEHKLIKVRASWSDIWNEVEWHNVGLGVVLKIKSPKNIGVRCIYFEVMNKGGLTDFYRQCFYYTGNVPDRCEFEIYNLGKVKITIFK